VEADPHRSSSCFGRASRWAELGQTTATRRFGSYRSGGNEYGAAPERDGVDAMLSRIRHGRSSFRATATDTPSNRADTELHVDEPDLTPVEPDSRTRRRSSPRFARSSNDTNTSRT